MAVAPRCGEFHEHSIPECCRLGDELAVRTTYADLQFDSVTRPTAVPRFFSHSVLPSVTCGADISLSEPLISVVPLRRNSGAQCARPVDHVYLDQHRVVAKARPGAANKPSRTASWCIFEPSSFDASDAALQLLHVGDVPLPAAPGDNAAPVQLAGDCAKTGAAPILMSARTGTSCPANASALAVTGFRSATPPSAARLRAAAPLGLPSLTPRAFAA